MKWVPKHDKGLFMFNNGYQSQLRPGYDKAIIFTINHLILAVFITGAISYQPGQPGTDVN